MRRLWTVAQRVLILVVVVYLGRLVAEAWFLYRIEHGSPNAKYSAAELLSRIASSWSIRALVDMQRGSEPEDLRTSPATYAFEALVMLEGAADPTILEALQDEDPSVRQRMVRLLGYIGDKFPDVLPTLSTFRSLAAVGRGGL